MTKQSKSRNELATIAINALAELNRLHRDHVKEALAQVAAGERVKAAPQIDDDLYIDLLEEIVSFDEDASATLHDMKFQRGDYEDDASERVSDASFDYMTGQCGGRYFA
jgi:hypothetical protein